MKTTKILLPTLLLFIAQGICAQRASVVKDYSLINPSEWVIPHDDTLAYALATYEGQKALLLKRTVANHKSASVAYPKDLAFEDGIIELDVASPGGAAGYLGFAFRIQDAHHYETLYFRPGSSGTGNAVQYMPEKKAEFNWWDYEDLKYQAKAVLPLKAWFHIKAVVKGNELTVFVNNGSTPVLVYKTLDAGLKKGSVGFWLGNSAVGAYKNLVVKKF